MGWQRSGDKFSFLVGRKLIRPDGEQAAEIDIEALAPEDWSEDFIAFHGHDAGDEQLADGFHAAGSYEGWVKAVALIAQYPRVLLGFYAAFVPVLLSVFDSPNFILDYCGQTSMGKTTILRVAASVWGCPDERAPSAAIGTWDATRVFIERSSSVLYSLPLILDDTKRARNPKVVGQTLYDVASGRGRGRGSPRGMRRAGSWTTLLLSSGEAPAVSYTEDGGTRARVLTLWGAPFGGADEKTAEVVNALNSGIRAHYGHAGPQFVQYVIRHRDQWDQWRSGYQQAHALYLARAGADPVVGRLAAYFAAIDETAFLVHQAFELPWYYPDPVASVWDALTREGAEADRASRALAFVLSWASGHEHEFSGRHIRDQNGQPRIPYSGVAGRWDDSQEWEFIAFYPDRIAAILEEQKFEVEAILRTWRERKWLIIDKDRSGFQGCVRIGRNNPRCVVINRKAFTDADLV